MNNRTRASRSVFQKNPWTISQGASSGYFSQCKLGVSIGEEGNCVAFGYQHTAGTFLGLAHGSVSRKEMLRLGTSSLGLQESLLQSTSSAMSIVCINNGAMAFACRSGCLFLLREGRIDFLVKPDQEQKEEETSIKHLDGYPLQLGDVLAIATTSVGRLPEWQLAHCAKAAASSTLNPAEMITEKAFSQLLIEKGSERLSSRPGGISSVSRLRQLGRYALGDDGFFESDSLAAVCCMPYMAPSDGGKAASSK